MEDRGGGREGGGGGEGPPQEKLPSKSPALLGLMKLNFLLDLSIP